MKLSLIQKVPRKMFMRLKFGQAFSFLLFLIILIIITMSLNYSLVFIDL